MELPVVSFLVSGRGSNFEAAAKKILSGEIRAKAGIVISNKADALALKKASDLGMPSFYVTAPAKNELERAMLDLLTEHKTDLVVAAGYMSILSPEFVAAFKNRIINIHPSLLPAFPGKDAQQQVLDYGAKVAGCTVHFIDEGMDTGPIIMQTAVPVHEDDDISSLSTRIRAEEHRILVESIKLFCEGRLTVSGRKVSIG